MYSNDIYIAVTEEASETIEKFIGMFGNYFKEVTSKGVFFVMKNKHFDEENDPVSVALVNVLSQIGHTEYAFVRFGEELQDSESHGSIQRFGITIKREVLW